MSIDVDAHIIVGLPMDKFKAEDMPLYEELYEELGEEPDILDLLEHYSYGSDILSHYEGKKILSIMPRDSAKPSEIIIGFPLAESDDYTPLEIGIGTLAGEHVYAAAAFYGLFKKSPKIYLVPRLW